MCNVQILLQTLISCHKKRTILPIAALKFTVGGQIPKTYKASMKCIAFVGFLVSILLQEGETPSLKYLPAWLKIAICSLRALLQAHALLGSYVVALLPLTLQAHLSPNELISDCHMRSLRADIRCAKYHNRRQTQPGSHLHPTVAK
jgi:hypothetical protein